MRLGYTLPEIQLYFSKLYENKKSESEDKFHIPIGGKLELREVYEVPLELPRYRLNNTRTIAKQEQYIASNDLPEDFFESDILSDNLQGVQHEILKGLITRRGLKEYFKDTKNIQTEPLILTHEGFVISGNRRLCTFRELYYQEEGGSSKYKHFQRVRAVILPMMTEEQIEYIEDHFEQQPEIQDEFTWTNRALGFERRLQKHNYSVDILSEKTNVKKIEIQNLLNKLSVAREYLEFIGEPKAYDKIETDEYAFNVLLKSRKKFADSPAEKDIFQKLSFISIKNQDQISDRMYNNIPVIQEVLENIKNDIRNEFSNELEKIASEDNNTLFKDLGLEEENNNVGFLEIIEENKNEEAIFSIVLDKVNEFKLLKKEKVRKQAVLRKIQAAHKELLDAFNIVSSETKKEGINDQLNNIDIVVSKLRGWLNK